MCIIIASPRADLVPTDNLKRALAAHTDGWGLWTPKGVQRSLYAKHLWQAWKRIPADVPVVFHARTATHGGRRLSLCHPFPVHPDVFLFHNGILNYDEVPKGESDTSYYARFLRAIPRSAFDVEALRSLVQSAAGGFNHLVMTVGPRYHVLSKGGVTEGKVWYSNRSAFEPLVIADNKPTGIDWRGLRDYLRERWPEEAKEYSDWRWTRFCVDCGEETETYRCDKCGGKTASVKCTAPVGTTDTKSA